MELETPADLTELKKQVDLLKAVLDEPRPGNPDWEGALERLATWFAREMAPLAGEYGRVTWQVGDVQTLFDVTDEDALVFLMENSKHLTDRLNEAGYEVLGTLGDEDDLNRKRDT